MQIIKFEKHNCMPCNQVNEFFKILGVEPDEIVNVEELPKVAQHYRITSVPVVLLLDDMGKEVKRVVGFRPQEIEVLFNEKD